PPPSTASRSTCRRRGRACRPRSPTRSRRCGRRARVRRSHEGAGSEWLCPRGQADGVSVARRVRGRGVPCGGPARRGAARGGRGEGAGGEGAVDAGGRAAAVGGSAAIGAPVVGAATAVGVMGNGLPRTCAEIASREPDASDGLYTLYVDRDAARPFMVYCDRM